MGPNDFEFVPVATFIQFVPENMPIIEELAELFGPNGLDLEDCTVDAPQDVLEILEGDWLYYDHNTDIWSVTSIEPDVYMAGGYDISDRSDPPIITYASLLMTQEG